MASLTDWLLWGCLLAVTTVLVLLTLSQAASPQAGVGSDCQNWPRRPTVHIVTLDGLLGALPPVLNPVACICLALLDVAHHPCGSSSRVSRLV